MRITPRLEFSAICRFDNPGAPAIIFMMPTTGPKSQSGKAVSSRNASKHGILSDAPVVVLINEDPREWERHRVATIESLDAEGHIEILIAERIANLFWRLKRLERYETEMIMVRLSQIPDHMEFIASASKALGRSREQSITPQAVDNQVSYRLIPGDDVITTIMRYEISLHRQCIQNLHELEAMQTRRQGGTSPLARLDIIGGPGD
jgi:hypothetical protein